jgi:hypothetical protein
MNRTLKTLAALAALLPGSALAHGKGDHERGIVESIAPDRIVIRTSDGHTVPYAVSPETRFSVGSTHVQLGEVHVGQRAVVHGRRSGDALTAVEVKLAPPGK